MKQDQDRFEKIHELQGKLRDLRHEYWRDDVLFSYQWFLLLGGMVGIFLLWLRFVDRSRLAGIFICGIITLEITTSLDVLGAELQAWDYPSMLLPWGARLFCVDFMISIIIMFLYQWFVSWRSYLLAAALMSLLFAFVLEPICIKLGIYVAFTWKHIYSLPCYFLLATLSKWAADRILNLTRRS